MVVSIPRLPDTQFQVGVSSGIYMAAHSPELGSIVRKLGYALTRGTNAIELAADVPHEIDYTQGKELRYIADKQGLTLLFHGSLTVPITMPERGEWRDAQDHIQKSVRSAVMGGCKYVNFHACLRIWLEMMTYAGRKLTMAFCDHKGNFISEILKENEKLREWFVQRKWDIYGGDILTDEERRGISTPAEVARDVERSRMINELLQRAEKEGWPEERIRKESERIIEEISSKATKAVIENYKDRIRKKLEKGGKWDSEELRAVVGIIDGYHIMAHYLYYKKDPIWMAMAEMYKDVVESEKYRSVEYSKNGKTYAYSPGGLEGEVDYWLDAAWEKAEARNDRRFKEFFYAVCAAKYIEGHLERTFEWTKKEDGDGLIAYIEREAERDQKRELREASKNLKITLEIPDARDPTYAGLYTICRVKQIYAAVKTIRETLKNKGGDKVFMLIDFEHITTQGFDAFEEIKDFVKLASDAGKYILSLHVTKPTPLHHHIQVEIGDIDVYKLLWELRTVGLGKHHTTYLIYERGGERDPFKQSVTAIKLMVDQLAQETKPGELVAKPEFFGVKGPSIGSEERQRAIIQEHTRDPIEGLLVVPEEKYTALGKAATEKAGAEKWKKEELT